MANKEWMEESAASRTYLTKDNAEQTFNKKNPLRQAGDKEQTESTA